MEANESRELLSQQANEHIVVAQAAGFGVVGQITKSRSFIREISVRYRDGKGGKKARWAFEREIDKAAGEVTGLRRQNAVDETEAKRFADQWQQEYETKKKSFSIQWQNPIFHYRLRRVAIHSRNLI